jgi:hypothetical protein
MRKDAAAYAWLGLRVRPRSVVIDNPERIADRAIQMYFAPIVDRHLDRAQQGRGNHALPHEMPTEGG